MEHVNNCTWFFGDGTTVTICGDVVHNYGVGWFTVKLELDTDLGYISNIEKKYYIKVYKARTTNFNAEFVKNPLSLHYGFSPTSGYGWSLNKGDGWVYPESRGALTNLTAMGDTLSLVWDIFDDKQYIISSQSGRMKNIYQDKCDLDGKNGIDIATEIILPEFSGSSEAKRLKHDITNLFIRSVDNSELLPPDMDFTVMLYDASKFETVDIVRDVNIDADIVFSYQNRNTESTSRRRIGVTSNRADYRFTGFHSTFISETKDRLAHTNFDVAQKTLALPLFWFSRQYNHSIDRVTGINFDYTTLPAIGPDERSGSGVVFTQSYSLHNIQFTGSMLYWIHIGNAIPPQLSAATDEVVWTADKWELHYAEGDFDADITFVLGTFLFDTRAFDIKLPEDVVTYYKEHLEACLPIF